MQGIGVIARVLVFTIVASLCAIAPAAAQSGADLEAFLQKFPITDGEPPNSPVTYYIDAWNFGPETAENVVISDVLPAGATFVSTSVDGCSYNDATRTFSCDIGALDPDTGFSADLVVLTPPTPTTMVNTVEVSSATPDPNPANNSMSLSIDVVIFQLSDLAVSTTVSASAVKVKDSVTFTSTVTNNGPSTATNVTWSAPPPFLADIVSFRSSQGACTTTEDRLTCELGGLAPGATATITLEVRPQKDGPYVLSALVSGENDPAFFDPDDSNNFDGAAFQAYYPGSADPAFMLFERQDVPVASFMYNPCGGEFLAVNGTLHQMMTTLQNKSWARFRLFTSYQDLNGVGLTSGTRYRVSGISKGERSVYHGFFPHDYTTVDTLKLIPEDGGDTLLLHQNTHVTVIADGSLFGKVTASVDNARLECK